jgi:Lar family restriction alleviation protein
MQKKECQKDTLRECPFCGGEAKWTPNRRTGNIHLGYIRCVECGAKTPQENFTEDLATDTWNRRV